MTQVDRSLQGDARHAKRTTPSVLARSLRSQPLRARQRRASAAARRISSLVPHTAVSAVTALEESGRRQLRRGRRRCGAAAAPTCVRGAEPRRAGTTASAPSSADDAEPCTQHDRAARRARSVHRRACPCGPPAMARRLHTGSAEARTMPSAPARERKRTRQRMSRQSRVRQHVWLSSAVRAQSAEVALSGGEQEERRTEVGSGELLRSTRTRAEHAGDGCKEDARCENQSGTVSGAGQLRSSGRARARAQAPERAAPASHTFRMPLDRGSAAGRAAARDAATLGSVHPLGLFLFQKCPKRKEPK